MKKIYRFLSSLLLLLMVFGMILTEVPALQVHAASEIPAFTDGTATHSSAAHDAGPTPNGGKNYQLTYSGVTAAEVKTYENKLRSAGYTLYDEREIKNGSKTNRFATYVNNANMMVHINYFPALTKNQFQIIYGSADYLLPTTSAGEYDAVITPSVSIIESSDVGLCMVIQLADGSYVVIDGGYNYQYGDREDRTVPESGNADGTGIYETYTSDYRADMKTLLAFLQDTNRDGKVDSKDTKPQVIWMATHADKDHIGLPVKFLADYKTKFDLTAIIYNFPNYTNIGSKESATIIENLTSRASKLMKAAKTNFPNAPHYIYHTGQILNLPGCRIEFLYTPEDYYPNAMTNANHTCGMWRFLFDGGKSLLITGDSETEPTTQAYKVFGSYLQSDMLQVIHHGANGATVDFNRAVNPEVCFWPCLDILFYHDKRQLGTRGSSYTFNKILRSGKRAHYTASDTTTVSIPTLTYNANGGSGSMDSETGLYCGATAKEGTSPSFRVNVAANAFKGPNNKAFLGWATSPSGDVKYAPGASIDLTKSLELYAVWATESYTVTFMDGNTVLKTETVRAGSDATAPKLPQKAGYTAAWDCDGKNITADTTIRVVYTPVTTQKPTEETTEEEPTEEYIEDSTEEEPTEEYVEDSAEEPTEEYIEDDTEEEPTEEYVEDPTEEVTEEIAEPVTDEATAEVTEAPTDEQITTTVTDGTAETTTAVDLQEPASKQPVIIWVIVAVLVAAGVITVILAKKQKKT